MTAFTIQFRNATGRWSLVTGKTSCFRVISKHIYCRLCDSTASVVLAGVLAWWHHSFVQGRVSFVAVAEPVWLLAPSRRGGRALPCAALVLHGFSLCSFQKPDLAENI